MCGIFAYLGEIPTFHKHFLSLNKRGPECSTIHIKDKITFGFHRLMINGLESDSNQPIHYDDIILICNGEIYNYKELWDELGLTPTTHSDCEVIAPLIRKFGIQYAVSILDGVFAFVAYDIRNKTLYVGRDPLGVRPLMMASIGNIPVAFSSDTITLCHLESHTMGDYDIYQFPVGSYGVFNDYWMVTKYWSPYSFKSSKETTKEYALDKIRNTLLSAVQKRVSTTERPIACLLSGGLDSSLIASLVNHFYCYDGTTRIEGRQLETYSIGLSGSTDLKYARMVAEYLGTKHTELVVLEEHFLKAIPNVIYNIESYDTTTVRASVGNYLVSKYIREHSDAKVIFNGDGADEVMGGYLYFHKSPSSFDFDMETKRLLNDISHFDVLRSDRCISSNGLEPRTPYLDKEFVQTYLMFSKELRNHVIHNAPEKYLIREAFSNVILNNGLTPLPEEILWRTKEAFSDGVSSTDKSWYEIIQEHIKTIKIPKFEFKDTNLKRFKYKEHNIPTTPEQEYYRYFFNVYFDQNHSNVTPYFWMPQFIDATDASARTLKIYEERIKSI
jgi:asparagine synthase (glutamine-hydrolysing)